MANVGTQYLPSVSKDPRGTLHPGGTATKYQFGQAHPVTTTRTAPRMMKTTKETTKVQARRDREWNTQPGRQQMRDQALGLMQEEDQTQYQSQTASRLSTPDQGTEECTLTKSHDLARLHIATGVTILQDEVVHTVMHVVTEYGENW